jgi:hypothetical protein
LGIGQLGEELTDRKRNGMRSGGHRVYLTAIYAVRTTQNRGPIPKAAFWWCAPCLLGPIDTKQSL